MNPDGNYPESSTSIFRINRTGTNPTASSNFIINTDEGSDVAVASTSSSNPASYVVTGPTMPHNDEESVPRKKQKTSHGDNYNEPVPCNSIFHVSPNIAYHSSSSSSFPNNDVHNINLPPIPDANRAAVDATPGPSNTSNRESSFTDIRHITKSALLEDIKELTQNNENRRRPMPMLLPRLLIHNVKRSVVKRALIIGFGRCSKSKSSSKQPVPPGRNVGEPNYTGLDLSTDDSSSMELNELELNNNLGPIDLSFDGKEDTNISPLDLSMATNSNAVQDNNNQEIDYASNINRECSGEEDGPFLEDFDVGNIQVEDLNEDDIRIDNDGSLMVCQETDDIVISNNDYEITLATGDQNRTADTRESYEYPSGDGFTEFQGNKFITVESTTSGMVHKVPVSELPNIDATSILPRFSTLRNSLVRTPLMSTYVQPSTSQIISIQDPMAGLASQYVSYQTLINPNYSSHGQNYTQDYQPPGSGPSRPPTRKYGGFGPSGPPPPPMGGCGCR